MSVKIGRRGERGANEGEQNGGEQNEQNGDEQNGDNEQNERAKRGQVQFVEFDKPEMLEPAWIGVRSDFTRLIGNALAVQEFAALTPGSVVWRSLQSNGQSQRAGPV